MDLLHTPLEHERTWIKRPRTVIADDQIGMLTKIFDLLRSEVDVVAAVGDGRAVIEAAAALDPDLIILDISMPIMNGLDAARKLAGRNTKAKLIFLTIYEPKEALEAALAAGAAGYVVKSRMHSDLIPMIRKVLE